MPDTQTRKLTHSRMRRIITDPEILEPYMATPGLGGRVDYPCLGNEANEYGRVAVNHILAEHQADKPEYALHLQMEIAKAFVIGMAVAFAHFEEPWAEGDDRSDEDA